MPARAAAMGLGVFLPDSARSIVVLSDDGELAVTLRDYVEPSLAVVRDARPAECARVLAACHPWPWMVVGNTGSAPESLVALAAARPCLVVWHGPLPPRLPAHGQQAERFRDVAATVQRALTARVAGMHLGAGLGVDLAHGRCVRSAELEALIGAHPDGFDLPLSAFGSAVRALRQAGVSWLPQRDSATGRVALAPAVQAIGEGVA